MTPSLDVLRIDAGNVVKSDLFKNLVALHKALCATEDFLGKDYHNFHPVKLHDMPWGPNWNWNSKNSNEIFCHFTDVTGAAVQIDNKSPSVAKYRHYKEQEERLPTTDNISASLDKLTKKLAYLKENLSRVDPTMTNANRLKYTALLTDVERAAEAVQKNIKEPDKTAYDNLVVGLSAYPPGQPAPFVTEPPSDAAHQDKVTAGKNRWAFWR